jgi:hypothetical protein
LDTTSGARLLPLVRALENQLEALSVNFQSLLEGYTGLLSGKISKKSYAVALGKEFAFFRVPQRDSVAAWNSKIYNSQFEASMAEEPTDLWEVG